jgi:3'-5' exoribonuclease
MDKKFIRDFREGDSVSKYFGVFSKSIRRTKTDKDYLDLILVDKTGKINAKIWDKIEDVKDIFERGDSVAVKGEVVSFNEELQVKVETIRRVDPELDKKYGYNPADLFPTTEKDIEQMWKDIWSFIDSIKNKHLNSVVSDIYSAFENQIKYYPGSMILHHAYRGGLLEHIHSLCNLANSICENYLFLDREIILTGVLLHDIGKIRELEPDFATTYTSEGNFIGHLVLGRDIFLNAVSKYSDFPEDLKLKVEHIILSHQGKYEWQSPQEPRFLEALVVYLIDEIDTRVNQMKSGIEADMAEGEWTSKRNYFRRSLYKGSPIDEE